MARTISTKLAIEGEAEFKAKLKNINAELSLYRAELEKAQAQHKNSANSLEALSAKQSALKGQIAALCDKYNEQAAMLEKAREAQQKFADKAEELRAKLAELQSSSADTAEEEKKLAEELNKAEENMQKAANSVTFYQKQLNTTERDQYKLTTELGRTEKYLDEAKASADGCAHSIDQYGKEVKEAGKSAGEFAEGTEKSKVGIEQLAAALAAAGVAKTVKEITDELLACAAAAGSFETAMAKVSTLAGPENLESMKAQLVELSNETGVAVGSLAEAAYQAMSAGVDAADAVVFVSTATKTSVAGFTDSATAVDVLTTALNAYNLEGDQAERVASMLVKTQDEGKTSVGELAQNMGRIIPVAAAYNVSLENLTTSYALLTKSGTNTNIATTNLSAMLTELSKSGSTVADVLQKQTGKSFAELMGSGQNLGGILTALSDSVDGDATAFSNLWSSTTAGQAALSLLNSGAEEFNRTLEVMENSSGAVERNFQTMADTTEFAQQRMANAAANLRIAIGDQLNPALEKLYAAGADAFTWATDFVEENPWVVAAITGLTVAFGVLAGGIAAVTVGASALKAALDLLSAHPLLLVATAAAGLATAIGIYMASADSADNSTRKFTKSLQESKAAYDDLMASMEEEQASVETLANSLKDLLGAESKSSTQKELIKRKVDELNKAVPGLALAYDEAADAIINMDTGIKMAVEDIDAMVGQAAGLEQYNAKMDRLSELSNEQIEISRRLEEAREQLAQAEEETANAVEYTGSSYAAAAGAQTDYSVVAAGLRGTINELTAAEEANAAEIAELTAQTNAYSEILGPAAQNVQTAQAAVDGLSADMEALRVKYEESRDAAYSSIESQLGLFNELDGAAKTSIDSLIETLQGQADYMDTYSANIQRAMEMGVDQGLISKLSDGSEKSAQILAAIVQGGEDDIEALNAALAGVEEGKENFSETVAQMETDFNRQMEDITKKYEGALQKLDDYEEAYKIAQNNIQGLIDGSSDPALRGALEAKYRQLAGAALAAYKAAVDQHSPSKEFAKAGGYDIQGLIEGAEREKGNLAAAYADLAKTALASYQAAAEDGLAKIAAAFKELDSLSLARADVGDLEYQVWERTGGKYATDVDKYAKQLELLNAKHKDQKKVVEAAAIAYEAAVAQYGEGAAGSLEYQKTLLEEKLALQDLLDEIEQVTSAKQELARQDRMKLAEIERYGSGVGRASAVANSRGYITPYEVSQIADIKLVSPDGNDFAAAYEDAAQRMLTASVTHLPSTLEAPSASGALERQLESITAAAVNAIAGTVQSGSIGPITINVTLPDGKVLASVVADPLVAHMEANGTPIVNK